ncbi:hypothetical protein [Paenibacillus sp. Z6-24]
MLTEPYRPVAYRTEQKVTRHTCVNTGQREILPLAALVQAIFTESATSSYTRIGGHASFINFF